MPEATINAARLNHTRTELGKRGDTADGMQRLALTEADIASRE